MFLDRRSFRDRAIGASRGFISESFAARAMDGMGTAISNAEPVRRSVFRPEHRASHLTLKAATLADLLELKE